MFHFTGTEKRGIICESTPAFLFLLKGRLRLQPKDKRPQILTQDEFVLLPPTTECHVKALEPVVALISHFPGTLNLCENFRLDSLLPYYEQHGSGLYPLKANKWIGDILSQITAYTSMSMHCYKLQEYKTKELLYLLRCFYDKESLARFFYPIINKDTHFREEVLKKFQVETSLSELALLMNYSVSGFKKRFKRCFGVSAFSWFQEKKAEAVLSELKKGKLEIKEIATLYRFSSVSRLNEFCKKHLGNTPGIIRKGNNEEEQTVKKQQKCMN